jgi:hypothetical protein
MTIKTVTTIELDAEITYSQICDTGLSIPDPFASITKPEFPEVAIAVPCPDCKIITAYQRHELIYRAS